MEIKEIGKVSEAFRKSSNAIFNRIMSEYEMKDAQFAICGDSQNVYESVVQLLRPYNVQEPDAQARKVVSEIGAVDIVFFIISNGKQPCLIYPCEEKSDGNLEGQFLNSLSMYRLTFEKKMSRLMVV
ncbi:MAG TPA: hypothetical protein VJ343_01525 [archaeon]|nr:hypothetical protein [archaeon]